VHVLERVVPRELAARELGRDVVERVGDLLRVTRRQEPARLEHARVRLRSGDVVRQEAPIEVDRRVHARRVGIEPRRETAAACALGRHARSIYVAELIAAGRIR
jgi:hypothetical protein